MTPPTNGGANASIDLILQAISRVEALVSGLDDRVRQLERTTIEQSVTAAQKIEQISATVALHTADIKDLASTTADFDNRIAETETVVKVVKWAGGIVAGMVALLLWGIFTHTITIVTGVP